MHFMNQYLFASLLCFACLNTGQADDRIDTKSEFLRKVADKKIATSNGDIWLTARQDGQIDGQFKGIKIRGKWNWRDGSWCRTARIGIIPVPRECQQITLTDNKLILTRFDGTGSSHTYMIK